MSRVRDDGARLPLTRIKCTGKRRCYGRLHAFENVNIR